MLRVAGGVEETKEGMKEDGEHGRKIKGERLKEIMKNGMID